MPMGSSDGLARDEGWVELADVLTVLCLRPSPRDYMKYYSIWSPELRTTSTKPSQPTKHQ